MTLLYLNESHLHQIGIDWNDTTQCIEEALHSVHLNDYTQPIKPYLRYGDQKNRIIAMPAFLGGRVHIAGIKWIASFPKNIERGLARAHSIIILNDADTGIPSTIINTPTASVIRTTSLSGVVVKKYQARKKGKQLTVGIVGWGPIGQAHYAMCQSLLNDSVVSYLIFDKRSDVLKNVQEPRTTIVDSWQKAYQTADIFITCTVADEAYIDLPPKPGSLHLNISLRDYKASTYDYFKDNIIVDDWNEVCRERTDIEMMHIEKGLQKEQTRNIADFALLSIDPMSETDDRPIFFNPMGMGVFDLAIASHYSKKARAQNIGILLQ